MMYEPELGQALFGQPHKEHKASALLIAALVAIEDELSRIMWNIHQEEYESPFSNTGNSFREIEEFQVEAYSWNDEYEQPWNFKWRGIEVSWYKYSGRGASVNREMQPRLVAEMLDACLAALFEYEKENDPLGLI